jgi:hypothetical protein
MPPMTQPFTGQPKSPMQPQVQQPARQLSPVRQYLNAMQQYRQGGRQGVRPTYAQFKQPQQPGMSATGGGQIVGGQPLGGMPPIQPMSDPFKPQISGGPVGTPPQPNQPPMPMKKGGFAAKPVWDKERPEDLNKPKSLSVKKKKAAKARAKAAGRPYPNLVDNMAAARKKGK